MCGRKRILYGFSVTLSLCAKINRFRQVLLNLQRISRVTRVANSAGPESLYHLDKLRERDLPGTRVTPQGISRLQSKLPGLVVTPHPGNKTLP
jgi:hypothetical protein